MLSAEYTDAVAVEKFISLKQSQTLWFSGVKNSVYLIFFFLRKKKLKTILLIDSPIVGLQDYF